ncbi:hypothetical protein IMZ48_21805, partial [Candidatus Bathyarchaeota archaeon]|nr:hypothetical protein [Candidatus Bathyarchaeota archaeon]
MTAATPRANTPRPAIQVSAPSAHSHSATPQPALPPRAHTPPLPAPRRPARSAPDYLSDKATSSFIRRTLCPQNGGDKSATPPIEEVLP